MRTLPRFTYTHIVWMTLSFAMAMLWFTHPAFAQSGGTSGYFYCNGKTAVGNLYSSSTSCPTTMGFDNIFSFVVCNMEQLSSNLLGNMFCGMITSLAPAVQAMLVLAVVLFGISFTIGLIPATAREFQMFLIKIAVVSAFATQSDFIIGIGYNFFINGIRDGVAIAMTNAQAAYGQNNVVVPASGSAVYAQLDSIVATFIHYATDYLAIDKTKPATTAAQLNAGCKNALFAVMAIMFVAFPPIFYLGLALLGKLALTFLRAVFGYIYALVGIAFLMTLSPFFVTFFLFRTTRSFFDKWIGYLASFALQIIILFAFLSFILSINVSNITGSFTNIVVRNQETYETGGFRMPWDYCTLCQFEQVDANNNVVTSGSADLGSSTLRCIKYDANDKPTTDGTGTPKPITIFNAIAPGTSHDATAAGQQAAADEAAAAATRQNQQHSVQTALLTFVSSGLLSLVILAYVVEALLGYVGSLAQTLAQGLGGYSAPQLGGGQSLSGRPAVGMPFEGNLKDFTSGFKRGYDDTSGVGVRNSIGATTKAFKEGASSLISGTPNGNADGSPSGIVDRTLDWLSDPDKFT